jgi:predicted DNA-binding transcriptional regulator YafY
MRRADRLFQIVQHLRGRRLTTASQLAGWLQVSERTIYRDVRDLSLSGVPVEGEAGIGYRLGKGFDLPPIMLSSDEVEALVAGARMIEAWGGPSLASHARSALSKIALALPGSRREEVERARVFAPGFHVPKKTARGLETVRRAMAERKKLRVEYLDSLEQPSERTIRPLGICFWGVAWTLAAWCELRQDFRSFRLDRMRVLDVPAGQFEETPGCTLEDFINKAQNEPSGPE